MDASRRKYFTPSSHSYLFLITLHSLFIIYLVPRKGMPIYSILFLLLSPALSLAALYPTSPINTTVFHPSTTQKNLIRWIDDLTSPSLNQLGNVTIDLLLEDVSTNYCCIGLTSGCGVACGLTLLRRSSGRSQQAYLARIARSSCLYLRE
jgi:hypothetical protein